MGLLSSMREERSSSSLSNPDRWFIRMVNGTTTTAGVDVDQDAVLSSTALFAGIRFIAQTVGMVPIKVYQRRKEGVGKDPAYNHPAYWLLHDEPNEEQTPIEFWEMLLAFAILGGNGRAQIIRDGAGRPVEMWPLVPHRIKPARTSSGVLHYLVTFPGETKARVIAAEDIFDLRGFGVDGLLGFDIVDGMREAIGTMLATERFAAAFYGNGATPSGFLKHPNRLSPEAQKNIKDGWNGENRGPSKQQKIALLQEGMEFVQISTDPDKAQADVARRFSVTQAARILNLPPHILRDLDRSTNNNIEQQSLELVGYSLMPWMVRIAQQAMKKLFLPSQRSKYVVEHVVEQLLRGDIKARYEAYAVGRERGWLNANDIREKENMNPIDGGDEYLVQVNMIPQRLLANLYERPADDESGDDGASDADYTGNDAARTLQKAMRMSCVRLFEDAASRIVRAETGSIRKALRKSNGGRDGIALRSAIDTGYADHAQFVTRALLPGAQTFAEVLAGASGRSLGGIPDAVLAQLRRDSVADVASRISEARTLIATTDPEKIEEALSRMLDTWEADAPASISEREMDGIAAIVARLLVEPTEKAA